MSTNKTKQISIYNNMCFRNCKILLCPSTYQLCMKAKEYYDNCINNSKQTTHLNADNYSINTSNNKVLNDMASNDMASNDMASNDMASNDMVSNDMVSDDEPCIYCYCCCCFAPFTMIYDCMCIPYTIYKEVVIREQIVDASLEEKLNSF
jgi:hypothetical protein